VPAFAIPAEAGPHLLTPKGWKAELGQAPLPSPAKWRIRLLLAVQTVTLHRVTGCKELAQQPLPANAAVRSQTTDLLSNAIDVETKNIVLDEGLTHLREKRFDTAVAIVLWLDTLLVFS